MKVLTVITYTYVVIERTQTDLETVDHKIRTNMAKNRIQHSNASVIRVYIPRKIGGREKQSWKKQIVNLTKYFNKLKDTDRNIFVIKSTNHQCR